MAVATAGTIYRDVNKLTLSQGVFGTVKPGLYREL